MALPETGRNLRPAGENRVALTRTQIEWQLRRLSTVRANCPACNGNPDKCRAGTPNLDRLPGCVAFTPDGQVAAKPQAKPKQPWEPRKAA